MFYLLFNSRPGALLPCLPPPSCFRPSRFPFYSSCWPPSPISWVGFPFIAHVAPNPRLPLGTTYVDARRRLLSYASSSCHLAMSRSTASGGPLGTTPPAFLDAVYHRAVSTPNTKEKCSVDSSVAQNSPKSTTNLYQVFNCPPYLGFSPTAIARNITRLGNRLLLCRAKAPASKHLGLA